MSQRLALLCPGRGSYSAAELGSLANLDEVPAAEPLRDAIAALDVRRAAAGDPTLREIDASDRFRAAFLHGENAAPLIFAISALELACLDPEKARIVVAGGNSMGWYTSLYAAGSLALDPALRLVETTGGMTRGGTIGGQVIYPVVDDEWRHDAEAAQRVEKALASVAADGRAAGHSIRFGGFAVLWAEEEAVAPLSEALPPVQLGRHDYPRRLFGNSAFHSHLMADAAASARTALADLPWRAPATPLIDGRGVQWRPRTADPEALAAYTLEHQIIAPFDFAATVRTMLREYAPDRLVALGPGETLTGAIAHVLIAEGWQGIDSREAFLARQREDPLVISMRRPEQAALVA